MFRIFRLQNIQLLRIPAAITGALLFPSDLLCVGNFSDGPELTITCLKDFGFPIGIHHSFLFEKNLLDILAVVKTRAEEGEVARSEVEIEGSIEDGAAEDGGAENGVTEHGAVEDGAAED